MLLPRLGPPAVLYKCLKSLCVPLFALSEATRARREDAAKGKILPILYALIRKDLSSICYLRLPFCNDARFLVHLRLLL